jgi:menaquinone-dependent protoporphyrinogen oxidase
MTKKVLVAYATKHGGTKEIAAIIGEEMQRHGLAADVQPVESAGDPAAYDAVVLGSAVYIGQWRKEAAEFLKRYETTLAGKPFWIFSSGPTGEGDPVELLKGWRFPPGEAALIERIAPRGIMVFHGVLDPETLNFMERFMIKNVKAPLGDFRDWDAVRAWAEEIAGEV